MTQYSFTAGEYVLLNLVKSHMWGAEPDEGLARALTVDDWLDCYAQASRQGVRALACEAAERLSEPARPPFLLMERWRRESDAIAERNRQERWILSDLCCRCREAGLEPVMLKGYGVATGYPQPLLREQGDADLWFPGHEFKSNNVLAGLCGGAMSPDSMHTVYEYRGLRIENHHRVVRPDRPCNGIIEPAMLGIWQNEGGREIELCEGRTITVPGTLFQLAHNARHMISHLTQRFVLRNVTDWIALTRDEANGKQAIVETYGKAGFAEALATVESLAVEYLGMPEEKAMFIKTLDGTHAARLLDHMLHPVPARVKGQGAVKYATARIRHFNRPYWIYKSVYDMSYAGYVALTIKKKINESK